MIWGSFVMPRHETDTTLLWKTDTTLSVIVPIKTFSTIHKCVRLMYFDFGSHMIYVSIICIFEMKYFGTRHMNNMLQISHERMICFYSWCQNTKKQPSHWTLVEIIGQWQYTAILSFRWYTYILNELWEREILDISLYIYIYICVCVCIHAVALIFE